jgi:hypothetical protein
VDSTLESIIKHVAGYQNTLKASSAAANCNERLERSNIAMHALYPQQMPNSQSFRTIFYTHHSSYFFGPRSPQQMPSPMTALILGSPFVTAPSTRGENSIDLDSLTSSVNRRSIWL